MKIEVKKFGTTLISRQSGKEALAAFEPSLKDVLKKEDVVIDFEGVITFSPSWGDEFLTPLAKRYKNKFRLLHTNNPSVIATVEILEESNKLKFNQDRLV